MASFVNTGVLTLMAAFHLPMRPKEIIRQFSKSDGNWIVLIAVFALLSIITVITDPEPIIGSMSIEVAGAAYSLETIPLALIETMLISALFLTVSAALALALGSQKLIVEYLFSRLPVEGFVVVWTAMLSVGDRIIGSETSDLALVLMISGLVGLLLCTAYFTFLTYQIGASLSVQRSVAAATIEFALVATVLWLLMHKGAAL